jgi:hypothetical protein
MTCADRLRAARSPLRLTDGRNRFVAALMLGVEHLLVAWLVPLAD